MNKTTKILVSIALLFGLGVSSYSLINTSKTDTLGATTLMVANGGTGARTFTAGECLYGNGTSAIYSGACSAGSMTALPSTQIYVGNASNVATATSSVTVSSAGVLSASGGTSAEWTNAYGWGDHAGLYDVLGQATSTKDWLLAQANTWTNLQTFSSASTTNLSVSGNQWVSGKLTVTGSTTLSNLNATNCDVKADGSGGLYCGLDTGGALTPWTENIDGGEYDLTNVSNASLDTLNVAGLTVLGSTTPITVTGTEKVLFMDENGSASDWSFNVSGGSYGLMSFGSSRGTLSSPTNSLQNDSVGYISFRPYNSTFGGFYYGGSIVAKVASINAGVTNLDIETSSYGITLSGSNYINLTSPLTTIGNASTTNLSVSGNEWITGNTLMTGTLGVTGKTTIGDASSTRLTISSDAFFNTIKSGTWNGTAITVAYGGTGSTTLNGILKGNGTSGVATAILGTDYINAVGSDTTWTNHNSYPAACGANTWATTIGDTLTCSAITYAGITAMTSANFATKITDETGTGFVVLSVSPTFTGKVTMADATSTNLTVTSSSFLGTIKSGTWNGSAIDISSYTNLTASNGIALSGDNIQTASGYTVPLTASTTEWITSSKRIWGVTVASTSPALIAGGLLKIPTELSAYTISNIRCSVQSGTSVVIAVEDEATNSTEDITCTTSVTSDDGTITNASYTAGEESYIDFGAVTGAVDYVTISVFGYWQ